MLNSQGASRSAFNPVWLILCPSEYGAILHKEATSWRWGCKASGKASHMSCGPPHYDCLTDSHKCTCLLIVLSSLTACLLIYSLLLLFWLVKAERRSVCFLGCLGSSTHLHSGKQRLHHLHVPLAFSRGQCVEDFPVSLEWPSTGSYKDCKQHYCWGECIYLISRSLSHLFWLRINEANNKS